MVVIHHVGLDSIFGGIEPFLMNGVHQMSGNTPYALYGEKQRIRVGQVSINTLARRAPRSRGSTMKQLRDTVLGE